MTISHDIMSVSTGLSIARFTQQIGEVGSAGATITLNSIRVKNDGTSTPTGAELTAVTAQLSADGTPTDGKETVVEKWLQAKPSGGAWTALGNGDTVALPSLSAGQTTDVEMRLVVPAGASVLGAIEPSLAVIVW